MIVRIKIKGQDYDVHIEDLNQRPVIARIRDERFEVWPEIESHHATITSPRISEPEPLSGLQTNQKAKSIHSPLPGTVTDIFIQAGAEVQTGETLLIIEAMKMKNVIRAGQSGKIAVVHIHPGQTVQYKQLLVDFE